MVWFYWRSRILKTKKPRYLYEFPAWESEKQYLKKTTIHLYFARPSLLTKDYWRTSRPRILRLFTQRLIICWKPFLFTFASQSLNAQTRKLALVRQVTACARINNFRTFRKKSINKLIISMRIIIFQRITSAQVVHLKRKLNNACSLFVMQDRRGKEPKSARYFCLRLLIAWLLTASKQVFVRGLFNADGPRFPPHEFVIQRLRDRLHSKQPPTLWNTPPYGFLASSQFPLRNFEQEKVEKIQMPVPFHKKGYSTLTLTEILHCDINLRGS